MYDFLWEWAILCMTFWNLPFMAIEILGYG